MTFLGTLTVQHSVPDPLETAFLQRHVDVVEVAQLLGIIPPIHVLQHRDGAAVGCRRLGQRLVHLVAAPRVPQEPRCDQHHPRVTILHSVAQFRHHRAPRRSVTRLEEAAEAFGLSLQVGHEFQHQLQVTGAVTDANVVALGPARAARCTDVRGGGWTDGPGRGSRAPGGGGGGRGR